MIYIHTLNMSLAFIEYKEYLRQKHKEEFILAATVAVLPEAEDVDIEKKSLI